MIPESKLIRSEITIRDMAINDEIKLAKKSMVRWLALSLGLVSPNESRTLIFDILEVLFYAHIKKEQLTSQQIFDKLESITSEKTNEKAVYYHLLKLKEKGFLMGRDKKYFLTDENKSLSEFLKSFYSEKIRSSFEKITQISSALEKSI
ncbi:MAG: hypothetical protein PHU63_02015 [Candidatus ainarchaeum sp.]|nr:hypothetical protein [Candidatus ainarchaeum sp.]